MKIPFFLWAGLLTACLSAQAQNAGRLGFELGVGVHAFHLPGFGAKYAGPQPVVKLGVYQALNPMRSLQAGVTLGYQRNKYQGDALYAQAQFRYTPLIANAIEPGIGVGVGYQVSFTPSEALVWDGDQWTRGKGRQGMWQTPLRLSLAYRNGPDAQWSPFVAYQANVLFGYSPDLSPLPVSSFTAGLRYAPAKKH
jgi:hypothetical protein